MSLLNDALRAAEQRQDRSDIATAYVGQQRSRQGSRHWLLPLLCLIIVILVAAVLYGVFSRAYVDVPVVGTEISDVLVQEPRVPLVKSVVEPNNETTAPIQNFRVDTTPNDATAHDIVSAEMVAPVPASIEPTVVMKNLSEVSVMPAVKRQRETPETVDLRGSKQLSKLLQAGDIAGAEALMTQLEKTQVAPVSREVLARGLLMQGMPDRALSWLSVAESDNYPALRLLKSRGLLSNGDLSEAVAVLLKDVPPVRGHAEYRITLATLLQQSGQGLEAARHWSALIATDDSRAAWWVGLAIALETQGEVGAALRAYGQAEQLPGLSPSLTDYVRKRMHKLQAG